MAKVPQFDSKCTTFAMRLYDFRAQKVARPTTCHIATPIIICFLTIGRKKVNFVLVV